MPDVEPPARIGQSRPVADRDLVAAGLAPGFVNGGGEAMKRLVLGGALAMRQGKTTDALTLQARAAALCGEMHMPREQVINLHVLGGYLIAASLPDRAREIYARSGEIARSHGLADAEASSELALGMMAMGEGRAAQAAKHYAAAGDLAEVAKVPPLAIECWRMAGQLALDAKLDGSAVECWKRALAVAGELDPAVAKATSAAEVARALAAVCRKRGLRAQADELERRSIAIEQGTVGAAGGSAASGVARGGDA
jgi:tetratricopeptide (TPR) repeat protein